MAVFTAGFAPSRFAGAGPRPSASQAEPEGETGFQPKPLITASRHMVAAAHPLAAEAGLAILRRGGNAIDAAIAAQMVLNLVEPQSSGIGGGGFILYWDAKARTISAYDGRETAPWAATPERFLKPDGRPRRLRGAVHGGLSVGAPGLLRVLELAHRRHGKLAWSELFLPAIAHADAGFPVSPRLHQLLSRTSPGNFNARAQRYFFDESGEPRPIGYVLKNEIFARTLSQIAAQGASAFYSRAIGRDVALAVQGAPRLRGDLSGQDLSGYRAKERPALCYFYRLHKICSMGPPSSGGLAVGQILKLVEPFDLGREPLNRQALHLIAEAGKLAYADRKHYAADPDFIPVPEGLLNDGYLGERRRLIDPHMAMEEAQPGKPPGAFSGHGADGAVEPPGTTHISVVDAEGNAVAMTTTIQLAFGSGLMVRGLLLNNQLTDFAFRPKDELGRPVANRLQPGKRPRSTMAPTLVFDPQGKLCAVLGSPGGSRIIFYVVKLLVAIIDWRLDAAQAVALINFGGHKGVMEIERRDGSLALARQMRALGHQVEITPMTSGAHVIIVRKDGLEGGADPRREGVAAGD